MTKKWWKIGLRQYGAKRELTGQFYYALAEEPREAIAQHNLFGLTTVLPEANECDPAEVPPVIRGLTEASVDELYDALKKRGWNVSLSR
jgi:hypothetical protein